MRRLVRFGRRQIKRLIPLSSRQTLGLGVVGLLCVAATVAALAGATALASAVQVLLLAAMLAGLVHLSRRMVGLHRTGQASVRDLRIVVEQLQRRVVAAVEKERLAAGDRHREVTDAITGAERLTPAGAEQLVREQIRETGSLVQLFQQVSPRAPIPPAGSGSPTDLLGLMHLVRIRAPKLTVVLGAGVPTVWLAYALERHGRLVVIEHDAEQVARARALLLAHDLTAVEVLHAPLTELTLDGRPVDWYDVDALDGLREIDLLLVDGPVAAVAEALPPALHVLGRRLAPGAAVVVEDGPRPVPRQGGFEGLVPERSLVGRWTALARTPAMTPAAG